MLKGRMIVYGSIEEAIRSHERAFPDIPPSHIAVARDKVDILTTLCNLGLVMAGDIELEPTQEINPPQHHIWVGHDS